MVEAIHTRTRLYGDKNRAAIDSLHEYAWPLIGGTMTTVDLVVTWTLTDGESGETIEIQSFGAGADGGDKYSGKASTSAMKYALLSGFLGGWVDTVLMRLTDMFLSLPQLPLLLLTIYLFREPLRLAIGPELGIFLLIVTIVGVLTWMPTARLVRAAFLSLKQKEFVEAARSIGAPDRRIIWVHILPNVLSPVLVAATVGVGAAIITESALSFLGLGFPSDVPTWGRMLYDAQNYMDIAPHWAIFPGLFIFLTVLSINYMGDGLRDALDPRRTGH